MSDPNNIEGPPPNVEERAAMARELDAVAPTPRTDAVNCEDGLLLESRYDKMHDLAEELERELAETVACMRLAEAAVIRALRERNEVREQRDRLATALEARFIAEIDRLKRERDNAESDRRQAEADTIRALHERNEARGQRDRLATCIRAATVLIVANGWYNTKLAYDGLRSALDELEGGAR